MSTKSRRCWPNQEDVRQIQKHLREEEEREEEEEEEEDKNKEKSE